MEFVGPRLGDSVDDPTRCSAILRRIIAGQHGKLLNRIHAQVHTQRTSRRTVGVIVDTQPVDAVIIFERLVAGDG